MEARVETYTIRAKNGRIVRTATRVRFDDGTTVSFVERMAWTDALAQARVLKFRGVVDEVAI